jgi:hypothetical protein
VPYGTAVTLTAMPATGWRIDHWSGACGGTTDSCQVTLDAPVTATATFAPITDSLAVVLAGSGRGEVIAASSACSGDSCFDCPTDACSAAVDQGATVTLTATAGSDSEFAGWSGPCTGTATCTVTIGASTTVHARFDLVPEQLTVELTGSGAGHVGAPELIDCGNGGSRCAATVSADTPITLTATPSATSRFAGWSGPCTGAALTCVVTLHDATIATADFEPITRMLTVEFPSIYVAAGGTLASQQHAGTVVGTGADGTTLFQCATTSVGTCQATLPIGAQVTLTGTPSDNATLSWGPDGGPCSGSAPCTFTFTAATDEIDAVFTTVPVSQLEIAAVGNGGDAVDIYSGDVDVLTCGGCREYIETGAMLDLYADASGSPTDIFEQWEGPCFGNSPDCSLTLDADTFVTAEFQSVAPPGD